MTDLDAMEHVMLRRVGGAVSRLDRLSVIWAVLDFGSNLFNVMDESQTLIFQVSSTLKYVSENILSKK